jgi:predicted dehydrogenase
MSDGADATAHPVAVGLVGAGTWAGRMHAPMLAAGPETRLAGVWSRRADAAAALAASHMVPAMPSLDALLDQCEAVAFAVAPDVQAALGIRAARAGRAVLLEKPLALTLTGARALADAVAVAGVVSRVVFTKRYHPATRAFLAAAAGFPVTGARACYLHAGYLAGPFAGGWRHTHGALYDLGPHVLDLLDAAVAPIATVHATGDLGRWVELTCRHENGAVSQASLSGGVRVAGVTTTLDLYGPTGVLSYDTAGLDHDQCWPVLRREFAAAVRAGRAGAGRQVPAGRPDALDVRRGLAIQELIEQARAGLRPAAIR